MKFLHKINSKFRQSKVISFIIHIKCLLMLRQITPNHFRLSINRQQRFSLAPKLPIPCNKQNSKRYVLKACSYSFSDSASRVKKTIFENEIQEVIFTYWLNQTKAIANKPKSLLFDNENKENLFQLTRIQSNSNIAKNNKQKMFRENYKIISQIHQKLGLNNEIFYLAIIYLSAIIQENSKFPVQFYSSESLSITVLRIATKIQNGRRYRLSDFNKYSGQQLSQEMSNFLQGQILKFFNFQMNKFTICSFIEFFKQKLDSKSLNMYFMVNYIIQLCIFYGILDRYQSHIVFFGTVSIAQMIYKQNTQIHKFRQAIKIDGNKIVDFMADICKIIEGIHSKSKQYTQHKFINAKYEKKQRMQVVNHLRDLRK